MLNYLKKLQLFISIKISNFIKKYFKKFLFNIFFLLSINALALTSDNEQLIYISSKQQIINITSNKLTVNGQVIIKRGSIDIRADKVIIFQFKNNKKHKILNFYGKPVKFYQLQDNGEEIRISSLRAYYNTAKDLLTLTGNVYLRQMDNIITGDSVVYLIKKQKIKIFSNKKQQIFTTLNIFS